MASPSIMHILLFTKSIESLTRRVIRIFVKGRGEGGLAEADLIDGGLGAEPPEAGGLCCFFFEEIYSFFGTLSGNFTWLGLGWL